jgi:tripartite-type tricarboxylate transporter receptor subunit TctC
VGPAGVPAGGVKKLSADITALVGQARVRDQLAKGGADVPNDTSTATFAKLLASEYERYARLVKEAGLKGQ